jgi:hypothetical protein
VVEGILLAGFGAAASLLALQWLGLVAAVAVLVLVGAYAARDVRPLENVALAGVMVLFSVGIFVWLLGLPLPLWREW